MGLNAISLHLDVEPGSIGSEKIWHARDVRDFLNARESLLLHLKRGKL